MLNNRNINKNVIMFIKSSIDDKYIERYTVNK